MPQQSENELPIIIAFLVILFIAYKKGLLDEIFGNTILPPPSGGGGGGGGGTPTGVLFVSVGDINHTDETVQEIVASGAPNIIGLGDYSYDSDAQGWWDETMAPIHNLKFYGTQGNHDDESYATIFTGNGGTYDFTVQIGPVLLISVNTEGVDKAFVQQSIEQGDNDASVKLIVPFMHIPVQGPPSHHANENTDLHDLFAASSKVLLVLSGHNHNYSRTIVDGITYCTVGTGGRDNPGYPIEDTSSTEYANDQVLGILIAKDLGSGLQCDFKENGGSVLDSFTITYATTANPTPPAEEEEEESAYARAYYGYSSSINANANPYYNFY